MTFSRTDDTSLYHIIISNIILIMQNHEKQFPRHNRLQQHSDTKRSTCSVIAKKKLKGKIDGYFGLSIVGHPPKAKFVAATACA